MLKKLFILIFLFIFVESCASNKIINQEISDAQKINGTDEMKEIRYVAIGDSYTIGEGIDQKKSWPVLLTNHLISNGIKIKLIANPSRTGWTTQQAIERELPVFKDSNPDFATLLIGVNDWVQGADKEDFRARFVLLLEQMQALLRDRNKIIIITIPDFSATPTGKIFSNGRDISKGIAEFNEIIKQESSKRKLKVVDIYSATQEMAKNSELIADDGLHPSAKEHEIWEEMIYSVAYEMLKDYKK